MTNPPLDTGPVQIVMIAAAHGMNTDAYTIPYVATWASRVKGQDPVTTVQQTAARVRAAALQTLDRLQTPQTADGAPPPAPDHAARARPQRSTGRRGEEISLWPRPPSSIGAEKSSGISAFRYWLAFKRLQAAVTPGVTVVRSVTAVWSLEPSDRSRGTATYEANFRRKTPGERPVN